MFVKLSGPVSLSFNKGEYSSNLTQKCRINMLNCVFTKTPIININNSIFTFLSVEDIF